MPVLCYCAFVLDFGQLVSLPLQRCQSTLAFTVCPLPFDDYCFLSSTKDMEPFAWV